MSRHIWGRLGGALFGLCLAAALLLGCSSNNTCPGNTNCPCDGENVCNAGLSCMEGRCVGSDDAGAIEQTSPDGGGPEGRCEEGTKSCRCLTSGQCKDGLRCERGICQTCSEGTVGCACKNGKTCAEGLSCEAGICKGCEGRAGCACYANNSCDKGHRCVLRSDGQSICEPCEGKGGLQCQCEQDNDCESSLICVNMRCLLPSSLQKIPTQPKCYSPCQGNVRNADGSIQTCHPTLHLMEGCLPGFSCISGSCVATSQAQNLSSQAYPFCLKTADCPSWQACIEGRCYSNCKADSECESGYVCHAYVCRRKCTLTKPSCDEGESCQNIQSTEDEGICIAIALRRDKSTSKTQTSEIFALTGRELQLNNREPDGFFAIRNQSAFNATFEISRESDDTGEKLPLNWLSIDVCDVHNDDRTVCKTFANKPSQTEPFSIEIKAGEKVIFKVIGAEKAAKAQTGYRGVLRVKTAQTTQSIQLQYRRTGTGRWKGKLYSFGNFDDTEIDKLRDANVDIRSLKNALLRRWINYKRGELSFAQFSAMLQSVREDTWSQSQNQQACQTLFSSVSSPDVACYPSSSAKGYDILSESQREVPVPSGVSSLDFGMNVKELSGNLWKGRIDTRETLHFPGNPQISIEFDGVPGSGALSSLKSLSASSDLGGRYSILPSELCGDGATFQRAVIPWIIPGFVQGSSARAGSLFREQFACRSQKAPWSIPETATSKEKATIQAINASLSAANPVPSGRSLRRTLTLIDGALLENQVLFALVRESFTSPFSSSKAGTSANSNLSKDWVRYGYLWLNLVNSDVSDSDVVGSVPSSCSGSGGGCDASESCQSGICQPQSQLRQVSCSPEIVKAAVNTLIAKHTELSQWNGTQLANLVSALMGNQSQEVSQDQNLQIQPTQNNGATEYRYDADGKTHYIHYYCEDTKQFDGGPKEDPRACPASSKVMFFSTTLSEETLRQDACQVDSPGASSCDARLAQLRTSSGYRENVPYRCADKNAIFCDTNRNDLREGKLFFKPSTQTSFVSNLSPLRNALFEAFRYRIKFQSRTGQQVGFTPSICSKIANSQTPYCYDPTIIEEIEQRVNCLEAIYADTTLSNKLTSTTKAELKSFLSHAFSYSNRNIGGVIFTDPGFETLNAELKVMLGDEAYTRALTSRYDLAASSLLTFEGDQWEPDGIQLSGVLGFEMHNLYLSAQYYQMVLDRFYAQLDVFLASMQSSDAAFLTGASVSSYVQKLLLAATRKARSWSQIAKKYHAMQRGDLARHVLERAYVSAYTEQSMLTHLLHAMAAILDAKQIPQLNKDIERMTLTYNSALSSMQETYQKVSQQLDLFGFPEGYIPFPALSASILGTASTDAFRYTLQFAKEKLSIAQEKEQEALQSKRRFDTDSTNFQSELVKLSTSYNEQLIQLCGELPLGNGVVPAIPKYAYLVPSAQGIDPCGHVPGSAIYNAYAQLETTALEASQLEQQKQKLIERIDAEEMRIKKFCDDRFSLSQITWNYQNERKDLLYSKSTATLIQQQVLRMAMGIQEIAQGWKCQVLFGGAVDSECLGAQIANPIRVGLLLAEVSATTVLTVLLNDTKKELQQLQNDFSRVNIQTECTICPEDQPNCTREGFARIQSQVILTQLTMELQSFKLRGLQAQYNMRLAHSNIQVLQQQVQRLRKEQEDAFAMLNNVTAAANDPNQRIYQNDAVIQAERTFDEAIKEAYRATLVYEYYTNQSYARKSDLFLVRMIASGDISLESYLSRLERAFLDYEEKHGSPSTRVLVLSLRDDILKIPHVDESGRAMGLQERVAALQKALNDTSLYDANGWLRIPFSIAVDAKSPHVSPVTFNHKVAYIEAEIKATERGDDVGRVYVRQDGTGVVRKDEGDLLYYALPSRMGIINAFFNGHKSFDPSVYRNYRLQDRPLGNTQWSLLFNQASETSNQDIVRNSINDIVLYIYYTDFSKP